MIIWDSHVINSRPGLRVFYNFEIRGFRSFINQERLFSVMLSWLLGCVCNIMHNS